MGVHTQGESGFFDDDPDELPAMVQNESIEQHETANATVVNLTGRGRVDMSNFELLKVLGTGGI
ncbi:Ribosomal protein s6 kinase alpha-5 [Daphnia magna]|uniref:Ribosomal protein s6 kinase alpha-5 n=1 Tax=Daphnia magna TaxID=35525 RepID=A0A162CQB3_9CRUS|nr:Ribosomal protein s6 kinase alpha-5 [Daphnia magna]